jgi:hypothetical protein
MRSREIIESEMAGWNQLHPSQTSPEMQAAHLAENDLRILEVLLDIRDLLATSKESDAR